LRVPVRIYLETDPVRPQIEVAQGRQYTIDLLTAHTHHFTFGENLGAGDCRVPVERFDYRPTRQPIVLDWWAPATRTAANGAGGSSVRWPCQRISRPTASTSSAPRASSRWPRTSIFAPAAAGSATAARATSPPASPSSLKTPVSETSCRPAAACFPFRPPIRF